MDAHVKALPHDGSNVARILFILSLCTLPVACLLPGLQLLSATVNVGFAVFVTAMMMAATASLRSFFRSPALHGLSSTQRFSLWVAPAAATLLSLSAVAATGAHLLASCLAALLLTVEAVSWCWLREDPNGVQRKQAKPVAAAPTASKPTLYIRSPEKAAPPFENDVDTGIEADIKARLAARFAAEPSLPEPAAEGALEDAAALPSGVTQQITRSAGDDDHETLHGAMRVAFQPGARAQMVHLPFCPPLATAPTVMAGVLDGPSATVKTVETQTFGCSLEIRLAHKSTQACEVVIEIFASASRAQEAA